MLGLVFKIMVEDGVIVSVGDFIFILEVMKMENVIKVVIDVQVVKVEVSVGQVVEKGQLLVKMKEVEQFLGIWYFVFGIWYIV